MTYTKFMEKLRQISIIHKLEYGEEGKEDREVSLTGEQGAILARRMFPKGKP